MKWMLIITILVLIEVLFWSPKSTSNNIAVTYPPQQKTDAAIDISVSVIQLSPGLPSKFELKFDTHSQDLAFEVNKIVSLVDDQGKKYFNATWNGSPPGGHHRSGTLTFLDPISFSAKEIKLSITNPTVEFIWNLQKK